MNAPLIGYARVSTYEQDPPVCLHYGKKRALRGDIVDELTAKNVKLNIGGSVHDPNDPVFDCCSTSSRWWPSLNQT